MPYKISGTKSETARVIILKESDWSIESNTVISGSGSYEVEGLDSSDKSIIARTNDGEVISYGAVTGEEYSPGARGIFASGWNQSVNHDSMDYITINSVGDAITFGSLTIDRRAADSTSNGTNNRGITGGGYTSTNTDVIDYFTITSTGDAIDFGDLTVAKRVLSCTSNNANNRGLFAGGYTTDSTNVIEYVTISSLSDATDFGDLTVARYNLGATSNGTNNRGVFAGGIDGPIVNTIDYITISGLGGTASDFGDLTVARIKANGCSNGTNNRGVFAGGYIIGDVCVNIIDYITIISTGNATNFGELSLIKQGVGATSNGTNNRGVFGGGWADPTYYNNIEYITITSLGDTTDFGDLNKVGFNSATSNA